MSVIRSTFSVIASVFILAGSAAAQESPAGQARPAAGAVVTAATAASGVRFVAPGATRRIRLEVYAAAGGRLFDSGFQAGGVIDWDGQGLSDGSYLCVLTAEDLQGVQSHRLSSVTIRGGRATVGTEGEEQLKAEFGQALAAAGIAREGAAPAARIDGEAQAVTLTAHDGRDGQVTSTTGALTFRTGDALSGRESERMRVTADGKVGIGTAEPQDALDVAGTIRARGGIRFDDGTVLTSARGANVPGGPAVNGTAADTPSANASGTGTQNRLAKWIDGSGTVGDSSMTELNGNVGVGTIAPAYPFHIESAGSGATAPATTGTLFVNNTSNKPYGHAAVFSNSNASNFDIVARFESSYASGIVPAFGAFKFYRKANTAGNGNGFHFSLNNAAGAEKEYGGYAALIEGNTAGAENGALTFMVTSNGTARQEKMRLTSAGNLGIGTNNPQAKLHVAGSLKLTGAGSGITFADGSVLTSAAPGGGSPSGTSVVAAINDAGTAGTINDNRLAANLGRRNLDNVWTGSNVFNLGLSANNSLITNVGNPVNAGDAVNKAYADANFVKFVPGAEQLSVGDANGTAPMINLRGGSTCCSGPGGHTPAFFKVFQNGSFVATGNLGIGTSPMEGKGYRTSWHTYKGAFRSGYADNEWDDANVGFFSWAGGSNSTASGLYALAFGDTNFARSTSSIAFGSGNEVKGAAGFSAGAGNRVCDTYGVALGNNARSGGPYIDGKCDPETFNIRGLAAVAIGYNVTADQDHTMALGKFASNNGFQGTFIWSDGAPQASADTFRNTANNEFAARATGGFRFRTNLGGTTGCNLPAGSGVFNCTSSRTTKENFLSVDGDDVLARLRKVPVSTWNYISEGGQSRHLGPMAEDFYSAFALGTSDKAIGVQDLAGVSLAAVKALDTRTLELQRKTEEVEQLRTKVNTLEQRLAALEQLIQSNAKPAEGQQK